MTYKKRLFSRPRRVDQVVLVVVPHSLRTLKILDFLLLLMDVDRTCVVAAFLEAAGTGPGAVVSRFWQQSRNLW